MTFVLPIVPARRWHRRLGLLLLLPFCGWAATGLVFFLKPGYAGAYAGLQPKWLPLTKEAPSVAPRADWLEARRVRTVLGDHLLVRTAGGRLHLHAATGEPFAVPPAEDVTRLVDDALTADPQRYGHVRRALPGAPGEPAFETTTGVHVTLEWSTLELSQRGHDTDLLDALYRVHYLQWTGVPAVDRAVGLVGLVGLLVLTALGLRLALR